MEFPKCVYLPQQQQQTEDAADFDIDGVFVFAVSLTL